MDNVVDLMSAIKLNTCPGGLSIFQRTCIVGIGFIIQISCFLYRNWGMFFFKYFRLLFLITNQVLSSSILDHIKSKFRLKKHGIDI